MVKTNSIQTLQHVFVIVSPTKIQDSRFKCIYSDINIQVQRYLSRRLLLRPFMIVSMGVTLDIILSPSSRHKHRYKTPLKVVIYMSYTMTKRNCNIWIGLVFIHIMYKD